jgi:hypothetical protein
MHYINHYLTQLQPGPQDWRDGISESRVTIIHEWKRDERLSAHPPCNRVASMYPAKQQNLAQHKTSNHHLM